MSETTLTHKSLTRFVRKTPEGRSLAQSWLQTHYGVTPTQFKNMRVLSEGKTHWAGRSYTREEWEMFRGMYSDLRAKAHLFMRAPGKRTIKVTEKFLAQ